MFHVFMTTYHTPVLVREAIDLLMIQPGDNVIDCTLGDGGHTIEMLKHTAPNGKVLGIDADEEAIRRVTLRIKNCGLQDRVIFVNGNFSNIASIIEEYHFFPVNAVLLDLGISSYQLNERKRGFSFQKDGPLQMTFSSQGGDAKNHRVNAWHIVNTYSKQKLKQIFKEYGEVKNAGLCADRIIKHRAKHTIDTTSMLVRAILGPGADKLRGEIVHGFPKPKIKLLARVFQSIRIAVNSELDNLQNALSLAGDILAPKGRIAVISYHSLEDRIVKRFLKEESKECACPPELPVCVCLHKPNFLKITKRPIRPSEEEVIHNPRSRSAKLRAGEKIFYEINH